MVAGQLQVMRQSCNYVNLTVYVLYMHHQQLRPFDERISDGIP